MRLLADLIHPSLTSTQGRARSCEAARAIADAQ